MKQQIKEFLQNCKDQTLTFIKENKCRIVNVIYQFAFAGTMFGGGEYYITQIQEAKEAMENLQVSIVEQVDRAEVMAKSAEATVNNAGKAVLQSADKVAATGKSLQKNVDKFQDNANKIQEALKKVEKTCKGGGLF